MQTTVRMLNREGSPPLAYAFSEGRFPAVMFLPGLRSDMTGTKATYLESHCTARAQAFCRFDYRGHGASAGRFEEGCVGDWCVDALAVLDEVVRGPVVLVGSSLGGWLMLLVALARPERVRGLFGIAAAPDFTERLRKEELTDAQRDALARDGIVHLPSAYGDPLPITRHLVEEGARHLVLHRSLPIRCPVHLLHGQADPDVPWPTSLKLASALEGARVTVELIKDGDHRLARPEDLRRITAALDRVLEQAGESC